MGPGLVPTAFVMKSIPSLRAHPKKRQNKFIRFLENTPSVVSKGVFCFLDESGERLPLNPTEIPKSCKKPIFF